MKILTTLILLLTLFTVAFSWGAFYEKLDQLRGKKEEVKDHLDLKRLGLSHLKDLSLHDLTHFHTPDMKAKLEKLKHIIPKDLDPSHHKEVDEFWTGVFDSFKLSKPADLINCFGTVSGQVFFRNIRTISDLLTHSQGHDNMKLHTDYAQLEVLNHALEHAHNCMFQTKDFERLTDALHITHDPEVLKKAKYLYFQAKYDKIADEYKSIREQIDAKNFNKAGKMLGELYRKSVKDFKHQGEDVLAYHAFSNGVAGTLGLPLPSQLISCYSSKDAKLVMDFFRGFAHAVSEGRWYRADQSAGDFWEKEGKTLLNKIPKKVWNCDMNSNESKQLGEKLDVDLNSQEFRDKMTDYIKDHNIMFYSYLRTMNAAFEKFDFLHAGTAYAHLLEAIAKSS